VAKYEVALKGHEVLAEGTMAFHFAKPAGFKFKPGQSVNLEWIEPPAEANSARRVFSLVSAPFEDELIIATRMRDGSAPLKSLAPGSILRLRGPQGVMTLHEDAARAGVFIAGGIGITPFMSMLRQAAHDRLAHRLLLLYANRRPEDAAFLGELQELEGQNRNFRLFATMTEMSKSSREWAGETRFVDARLIKQAMGALAEPVYYVVGPPGMVAAMRETLRCAGVGGEDVKIEEFYGY
jgi:ferredoxin-NADP reductase